jgi:acetylglutamate kinase
VASSDEFAGKTFVVRVDDATAHHEGTTLVDDLQLLCERAIRPIVVAPNARAARSIVRTINRSANVAVTVGGSDAATLPRTPSGLGRVQTHLLDTLTAAGFIPVIEPTAFSIFDPDDADVIADEVAAAIAAACEAVRAIFFHPAGGVSDPATDRLIDELTPAEALALADDERVPADLRVAVRAAAMGVRSGIPAAHIVDGRIAHAAIVEVFTAAHLGTQVTGGIILAA